MKIGCDEAGRGPVFGSMFIGCVYANESELSDQIDDSKNLKTEKIHTLAEEIKNTEKIDYTVIEVTVDQIDNSDTLTDLTARSISDGILSLPTTNEVIVDCFTNDKNKAKQMIENYLQDENYQIRPEFKADENYPIVGAASILAKSHRENHIDQLKDESGDIGSGYPSDPNTQDFLDNYVSEKGTLPPFARKSWNTSQDILDKYNI